MASDILVASPSQLFRQLTIPVMSSKVVGNSADGNALQLNGPVVEKQETRNTIIYTHIKTLNVHSRDALSQGFGLSFLAENSKSTTRNNSKPTAVRIGTPQPVVHDLSSSDWKPAKRAAIEILHEQGSPTMLLLYTNQPKFSPIGAIVCFDHGHAAQGNWIRKAVLKRLRERDARIVLEQRDDVVRRGVYNGKPLKSNGAFVDFAWRTQNREQERPHRFYVLDHADFDVLIGKGSELYPRLPEKVRRSLY